MKPKAEAARRRASAAGQAALQASAPARRIPRPAQYLGAGLGILALVWLTPVLGGAATAVRTLDDVGVNGFWSWPQALVLDNFITAWTAGRVARYLLNSLIITVPAVLAMLLLASLSAYALAHFHFRGRTLLYVLFAAGTMLPHQVLLLPIFRLTSALGLYDSYAGLIVTHTALQLGFGTLVLRSFMRSAPGEILDAARVDGCGELRLYWQIVLPLILPALAAVAVLEFTWVFNDYLWATLLLRGEALRPVTAGLAALRGEYTSNWPVIAAGALLAAAPPLLVFLLLQRRLVQGWLFGATH
jgi:multiple sugar transport system permease protein